MRLARLDLTRYGRFTDHVIDFGARRDGVPDLHLVYGPNEAGKSTTFNAYLDLLYGIGGQSPYNFLHDYKMMRIGARLELEDGAREVARVKRQQNTLIDPRDQVLPESVVRAGLGGIDRDAYRTMFSLDDETLEKGGEAILASKGELGELLFSASAGLSDLGQRLRAVGEAADAFHRPYGRKTALAVLKDKLAELRTQREALDTAASDFARLVAARTEAGALYAASLEARAALKARLEVLRRQLGALPRLADLRAWRAELAPLAGLPEPPPGWDERVPQLQQAAHEVAVSGELATAEIRRLAAEVDAIAVDEAALACAGRLADLGDLRARFVTAQKDLPQRRHALEESRRAVFAILARLGREGETEPDRLTLPAAVTDRLRALIETHAVLEAEARRASEEHARARAQHEAAGAALGPAAAASDPSHTQLHAQAMAEAMADLREVHAAARSADHAQRLRRTAEAAAFADEDLAARLDALAPWHGTARELLALPPLTLASVQHWKSGRDEAAEAVRRHRADLARLEGDCARLAAERDAITHTGIVDAGEAEAVRAAREAAWTVHRRTLDGVTADAFEAALRRDDKVVAARAAHLQDAARLHATLQALAVADAGRARTAGQLAGAEAALRAYDEDVAASVRFVAPALGGIGLAELEVWIALRERAVTATETASAARHAQSTAETDARDAAARLTVALARTGRPVEPGDLDSLMSSARMVLEQEDGLRQRREELARLTRDLNARAGARAQAQATLAQWEEDWASACRASWLGEAGGVPAIATVRDILSTLGPLAPALAQVADLERRIDAMVRDQSDFVTQVRALAGGLGLDSDGAPLDLFRAAEERARGAGEARALRAKRVAELEAAQANARAGAEAAARHSRQVAEITGFLAVPGLIEAAQMLVRIGRRDALRADIARAEREIVEALGVASLAEAEARLDAADRSALEAERDRIEGEHDAADHACREAYAAHQAAEKAIRDVGGDDRVARLEAERRTVLLEIEERALDYLRLRAGALAAGRALEAYRERHRSSMMARASEAFRTISRRAYSGLASHPAKDGEVLVAIPAQGGSKAAAELSKGTRFQLYLALRVAGYHEFAKNRAAPPFIADDIMETFDDFRAEEAFRLLADMAMAGQVIYLTHHRHLCDIARAVCPGVQVHELVPAGAAA